MRSFPGYEYGLGQAAGLARSLGVPAISAVELGVAAGSGLVALERMAAAHADPAVAVTGFDLGTGLPEPLDYRDEPYAWRPGFYKMDERVLRSRLAGAELVMGDVAATTAEFIGAAPPPLGFIAFDLDYYSSTAAAMTGLLNGPPERYLPRVLCYFDDTVGRDEEMHSQHTGELLAIAEFSASHDKRKIAQVNGLRCKLGMTDTEWAEGIYVLHVFDHPRYCDYVCQGSSEQLPLS